MKKENSNFLVFSHHRIRMTYLSLFILLDFKLIQLLFHPFSFSSINIFFSMAALSSTVIGHYWSSKRTPFVPLSCHHQGRRVPPLISNSNPQEKKDMGGGKLALLKWKMLMNGFEKLIGKRPDDDDENLSPQQKGDWKDLLLMSISFAVYVYISQKLVCAYCVWTSMPKQVW